MILSEKKLRQVIRDELERFMEAPQEPPSTTNIKAANGAEIIMPNFTRERFDAGEVNSFKDIL